MKEWNYLKNLLRKKGNFFVLFSISIIIFFSGCNWGKTYYTVTYESEYSKDNVPAPIEILADSALTVGQTKALKETGHIFQGWYDGETLVEAGKYIVTKDITLVAHWDYYNYSIKYYLTGGVEVEGDYYKQNYTISDEDYILPTPVQKNYVFAGWFESTSFSGEPMTVIEKGHTGNIVLFAKWTPIEYKITYILPDDGRKYVNSSENLTVYTVNNFYDELQPASLEETSENESSENKKTEFLGWYLENDPNSTKVTCYRDLGFTDVVVYGLFSEKKTITYKYPTLANSEAYEDLPQTKNAACGLILGNDYLPDLFEDDYEIVFLGWYTDENFADGTQAVQNEYVLTSDVTFYARLSEYFTISYDTTDFASERQLQQDRIVSGNYFEKTQLPILYHNGKKIEGWFTEPSYETEVTTSTQAVSDITLYAKWTALTSEELNPEDAFVLVEGTFIEPDSFSYNSSLYSYTGISIYDFYIAPYEVTQALYTKVMDKNPSRFKTNAADGENQENRPVETVSWYDALYFCNKLSIQKGLTPCYQFDGDSNVDNWGYTPGSEPVQEIRKYLTCDFTADGYRLPTSEEWEYAARGGQNTYSKLFSFGDDYSNEFNYLYAGAYSESFYEVYDYVLDEVGWYWHNINTNGVTSVTFDEEGNIIIDESYYDSTQKGFGTHEVGKKSPNALGLYDMSGNVWEYVYRESQVETFNTYLLEESAASELDSDEESNENSSDDIDEDSVSVVLYATRCGGSWNTISCDCSVSSRDSIPGKNRNSGTGFRLVRSVPR